MKKIVKVISISIPSLVAILIALELVFTFIIPASKPPHYIYDEKIDIQHFDEANGKTGLRTQGRFAGIQANWQINNHGWNSIFDYQFEKDSSKKRIAVIGDSYVEGLHVNVEDNFSAHLQRQLSSKYEVFGFGQSGFPLSQYLHLSRYVSKNYKPDILLFLIVSNDFIESLSKYSSTSSYLLYKLNKDLSIEETPPTQPEYHSIIYKYNFLKKSALVRYLFYNIQIQRLLNKNNTNSQTKSLPSQLATMEKKIDLIIQYSLQKIKTENPETRIIIVTDAEKYDIYNNNLEKSEVQNIFKKVHQTCEQLNLEYIDLAPIFMKDYQQNEKPFDFAIDGHFNSYTHQIVGNAIFNFLNRTDTLKNQRNY